MLLAPGSVSSKIKSGPGKFLRHMNSICGLPRQVVYLIDRAQPVSIRGRPHAVLDAGFQRAADKFSGLIFGRLGPCLAGFHVEATMTGASARDLNRARLRAQ